MGVLSFTNGSLRSSVVVENGSHRSTVLIYVVQIRLCASEIGLVLSIS